MEEGHFFGRGNEIHYIGGTEILPAPLDTAEEQKMIHMLGTVNEENGKKHADREKSTIGCIHSKEILTTRESVWKI